MGNPGESTPLGLHVVLQHPTAEEAEQLSKPRTDAGDVVYPEVDADGDHIHFEMVPMGGKAILWMTIRRGTDPQLASTSLRKIADLMDRHGTRVLSLLEGREGSFSREGDVLDGPLRLGYDENGDLIIPTGP